MLNYLGPIKKNRRKGMLNRKYFMWNVHYSGESFLKIVCKINFFIGVQIKLEHVTQIKIDANFILNHWNVVSTIEN